VTWGTERDTAGNKMRARERSNAPQGGWGKRGIVDIGAFFAWRGGKERQKKTRQDTGTGKEKQKAVWRRGKLGGSRQ